MFRSIASQLALVIGTLFLLATIALFQWYFHNSGQFADEVEQTLHRDLAAFIIHDDKKLDQGIIETDNLSSAFHSKMLLGPEWELYALDIQGKVLAYSAPDGVVKLQSVKLKPIQDYLSGKDFPLYGDDPRTPNTQKIFSVSPIIDVSSSKVQGYLYVIIGGQQRDTLSALLASSKVIKDGVLILATTILFALTAMIFAVVLITKPLKRLSERSVKYVGSDFKELNESKIRVFASKEINDLEFSFMQAADHIKHQLSQIKTTEQLRRELLSHISHDFRTPLTALNGYLETWLITPQSKRHSELIELAYKNGLQVNQLVEQLFELARLESGDIQFIPEAVNVVELAHDVMQRLRYQAEKQQVTLLVRLKNSDQLEADAHQQKGVIAYADISKLERILVNLIDNAIRHTQENGQVALEVIDYDNKVAMNIIDNGKGIEQNELEAIFQPKYQASNTQGTISNAGLGLTIVKRFLDMHHSSITVNSQPGIGSQFSFNLQKVK
jgi:signal transduction histidine kinase